MMDHWLWGAAEVAVFPWPLSILASLLKVRWVVCNEMCFCEVLLIPKQRKNLMNKERI